VKLIFVTQQVDAASPVLGATVAKLNALAAEVDEVVVLSLDAVPGTLRSNCRVRTFGGGRRLGRAVRFVRALAAELRGADAVVAHMCPIYAVLAAPLARPLRIPVLLWYAHWHASPLLRLATRLATVVLSVDESSYPVATRKLVAIGHGIDYSGFTCVERKRGVQLRALVLGRYSPAKGLESIVRAAALVPDVVVEAHGTTSSPEEEAHLRLLGDLVRELGISGRVELGSAVQRHDVPELHGRADVLVNNMRAGAPDKVVYEACGSCLPVLVSNPSFDELFADVEAPLRFARERPEDLAERLRSFAALDDAERARIGAQLRERAVARHSVDAWARSVVALVHARRHATAA
jgi:glycosyltransferase involved in cell wall biosynthesis